MAKNLIEKKQNRVPKINFGEVKVNTLVERILLITNRQDFTFELNVTNQDLDINNMEIPKNTNVDFKIRWQPEKPVKYKYAIMFEVIDGAKLKSNFPFSVSES